MAAGSPWHQSLSQPQITPQIQLASLMFFCWLSDLKKCHRKEGGQCVGMLSHCFTASSHPPHTRHQQPTLQPYSSTLQKPQKATDTKVEVPAQKVLTFSGLCCYLLHTVPLPVIWSDFPHYKGYSQSVLRTPPGHHRDTNWSLQGKSAYQLGSSSLVDLNALYQRQLQESISSVKHFHLNPSEHYSHLIKTKLSMLWPWPAPRN